MIAWDVDYIFEFCGGAPGVSKICAQADTISIPPSPQVARVWKSRGRIAQAWLPVLVAHCLSAGMSPVRLFREHAPIPLSPEDVGL